MYSPRTLRRLNAEWRSESDNELIRVEYRTQTTMEFLESQGGLQFAPNETLERNDCIDNLFVDTSGYGSPGERALTQKQFCNRLADIVDEHGPVCIGITEAGQFQAYVGVWPTKSDDMPDFDHREIILKAAARAMFADAWATHQEENGQTLMGDILNLAPATSDRAHNKAEGWLEKYESANGVGDVTELFKAACELSENDLFHSKKAAENFGHYKMMEALGHGVAWSDNYPSIDDEVPSMEFWI